MDVPKWPIEPLLTPVSRWQGQIRKGSEREREGLDCNCPCCTQSPLPGLDPSTDSDVPQLKSRHRSGDQGAPEKSKVFCTSHSWCHLASCWPIHSMQCALCCQHCMFWPGWRGLGLGYKGTVPFTLTGEQVLLHNVSFA